MEERLTRTSGSFALSPPLTREQVNVVQAFNRMRHGSTTKPWLIGFWCQWTVTGDGEILKLGFNPMLDHFIDWLHYLYYMFFSKWQVTMEGCVYWQGIDPNHSGTITATPFLDEDGMRRTRFTVKAAKEIAAAKAANAAGSAKKVIACSSSSRPGLDYFRDLQTRPWACGGPVGPAEPVVAADAQKVDAPMAENAWPALEDLPMEIVARIACFLDVEDVMHFRAVCKLANTCCTRREFLRQWCEHWKHKLGCLVFTVQRGRIQQCYKLAEHKKVFPISGLLPAPGYLVVSASGGLVCCCNGDRNSIMVRNPVTKQWLELPPCPLVKFSTWHLISYPDGGDAGGMFFVVVDATCKCWFNSKLGTWNLGDGVYQFVISSANLLRLENGTVYALADMPGGEPQEKGLVQLDLEDVSASRLLCRWVRPSALDESAIYLLEHKGKLVLKNRTMFWALDQNSGSWELLLDHDDELRKWKYMHVPNFGPDLSVLPVDITFASARMNKNWDRERCAGKYWGICP